MPDRRYEWPAGDNWRRVRGPGAAYSAPVTYFAKGTDALLRTWSGGKLGSRSVLKVLLNRLVMKLNAVSATMSTIYASVKPAARTAARSASSMWPRFLATL